MPMSHRAHLALVLLATAFLAQPCRAQLNDAELKRMRAERRVALVIGNGHYRNFETLDNPTNDARGVGAALQEVGFQVTLRLDATREDMAQALEEFDREAARADVALFYFAGHATQVDWHNFMLPVSARLDANVVSAPNPAAEVAHETVDLSEVLDRLGRVSARRLNIVILDACRNNPFSTQARELSRSLTRGTGQLPVNIGVGLGESSAPARTLLAYATAPGQVASDGSGRNSPYSGALIQALAEPGLRLEDVFKHVRAAVSKATEQKQIPWENSSVFDDFYFRVPANAQPQLTKPPTGDGAHFVPP